MANNRFSNLRKIKPAVENEPPFIKPNEKIILDSSSAAPETTKRGRPRAKRSSDDFAQATAYIRKDTYTEVKHLLLDQKKEYSVLVQELLDGWLQKQR